MRIFMAATADDRSPATSTPSLRNAILEPIYHSSTLVLVSLPWLQLTPLGYRPVCDLPTPAQHPGHAKLAGPRARHSIAANFVPNVHLLTGVNDSRVESLNLPAGSIYLMPKGEWTGCLTKQPQNGDEDGQAHDPQDEIARLTPLGPLFGR
jgi:hypothetical protein